MSNGDSKKKKHNQRLIFHRKAQHLKPLEPVIGSSCIDPEPIQYYHNSQQHQVLSRKDLSGYIYSMSRTADGNDSNQVIEVPQDNIEESFQQAENWTRTTTPNVVHFNNHFPLFYANFWSCID
jgi:hypothetical protein